VKHTYECKVILRGQFSPMVKHVDADDAKEARHVIVKAAAEQGVVIKKLNVRKVW